MSRLASRVAVTSAGRANSSSALATISVTSLTAEPTASNRRTPTSADPVIAARGSNSPPSVTTRLSLSRSGDRSNRISRDSPASTKVESGVACQRKAARAARSSRLRVSASRVPSKNSSPSNLTRSSATSRSSESFGARATRTPPFVSVSTRRARTSMSNEGLCRVSSRRPAAKKVRGPAARSKRARASGLTERSPSKRSNHSPRAATLAVRSARRLKGIHASTAGVPATTKSRSASAVLKTFVSTPNRSSVKLGVR